MIRLLMAAALWLPINACAETLYGRVVGVSDGDTLTILTNSKSQVKIRLAAIDAPEKSQAFGSQSKQALSDTCFGKAASIEIVDTDRYGRTVGVVTCDGVRANDAQVSAGMAWVYRKYAEGFGHLYKLEEGARASQIGLWRDKNPTPPWEWRKAKRGESNL